MLDEWREATGLRSKFYVILELNRYGRQPARVLPASWVCYDHGA